MAVRQITTALSERGARVGLLPWPTAATITPADEVSTLDEQADATLSVIDRLGRTGVLDHLPAPATESAPAGASLPFWAPLITPDTHSENTTRDYDATPLTHDAQGPVADLDLIITSLAPSESGNGVSDLVALHAARRLRAGGILTVLTHSEHTGGALIDPTGTVVAAGQNGDLLYLQHVVVLHTPLHRHPFTPAKTEEAAADREPARGHRRTHSDLLVFAQPTDPALHAAGQEAPR